MISFSAFSEELQKLAVDAKALGAVLGAGALLAAANTGAVLLAVGPSGRRRVNKEIHDPRLYSNLRGMASLESAKERVAAHKKLDKGGDSIIDAMHSGFMRKKL